MIKTIWISFDFGLKGDYQGLYAWLDNYNAVECGQNLALIKYPNNDGKLKSKTEFINKVKEDLKKSVSLSRNDRVYIIFKDPVEAKMRGVWINSNRKAAPWEGYGKIEKMQGEDEGE